MCHRSVLMWCSRADWFSTTLCWSISYREKGASKQPVISGVAGGSWQLFKWATKAFFFLSFSFINSFKVLTLRSSELQLLKNVLSSSCYLLVTANVKIKFADYAATLTSFTFLYINSLPSFSFHELTKRSEEWEAAPLNTICECEMCFVV